MSSIIEVNQLWKQYKLRELATIYKQTSSWLRLLGSFGSAMREEEKFWALRDVTFELKPGEVLGLVGPNGSGKTTLLRLLAGISPPTRGNIKVKGRVGALIALGAGFHAEMTGRENIYLNGAILGMSKGEINRKFDSIVSFSELEEFLDMPVKRYSSGMAVRLGFAIAVHMEPEILLVDEVLAVGDLAFKQKCLERIEELFQSGITVIFVSHNLMAVNQICRRGILLDKGAIVQDGPVSEVLGSYFKQVVEHKKNLAGWKKDSKDPVDQAQTGVIQPISVCLLNSDGKETDQITQGETIKLRIEFNIKKEIGNAQFLVGIHTPENINVLVAKTGGNGNQPSFRPGRAYLECTFKDLPLLPAVYGLWVGAIGTSNLLKRVQNLVTFSVVPRPDVKGLVLDNGMGHIEAQADWSWANL